MTKYTDDMVGLIRRLARKGLPSCQIAIAVEMSQPGMVRVAELHGITLLTTSESQRRRRDAEAKAAQDDVSDDVGGAPVSRKIVWTPDKVETLCAMWPEGIPVKLIAKAVGLTQSEVRSKRAVLKLPQRAKGMSVADKWPEHKKATLKREYLRGTNLGRIAEMVGKTAQQVKAQRVALGLDARGRMDQRRVVKVYVSAEDEQKIGRRAMVLGVSASAYVRRCITRELSA